MRRLIFSLILFLMIAPCFGKNTPIVILGQSIRPTDKQEYIATTINLINLSYKDGQKIYIGAPRDLQVHFEKYPNVVFMPVSNKSDISIILDKAASEKSKNYTMMVFAHGLTAKSEKHPESARIYLSDETPKIEDIAKIINDKLPTKSRLKIMAPFCYSGAIHHLSRSRKNTCSIAASDFRTISRSQIDCFGNDCVLEKSWALSATQHLQGNPNSTLSELMTVAQGAGDLNDKRGDISSIDYLKFLYRVKPYAETRNWFTRLLSHYPEESPKENHIIDLCPEEKNLESAKKSKIESLVNKIEEIILKEEMLFSKKVPEVIKKLYERKLHNYLKFLQDKKHTYFEFLTMYQEASKLNIDKLNRSQRQQLESAAEQLRLSSNNIFEFVKIVKEMDLINQLYKDNKRERVQKFEDMFRCENNLE